VARFSLGRSAATGAGRLATIAAVESVDMLFTYERQRGRGKRGNERLLL
jgi:hypothetical protein